MNPDSWRDKTTCLELGEVSSIGITSSYSIDKKGADLLL